MDKDKYDRTISLKLTEEQYNKLIFLFPCDRSATIRALIEQLIDLKENFVGGEHIAELSFDEIAAKVKQMLIEEGKGVVDVVVDQTGFDH